MNINLTLINIADRFGLFSAYCLYKIIFTKLNQLIYKRISSFYQHI